MICQLCEPGAHGAFRISRDTLKLLNYLMRHRREEFLPEYICIYNFANFVKNEGLNLSDFTPKAGGDNENQENRKDLAVV